MKQVTTTEMDGFGIIFRTTIENNVVVELTYVWEDAYDQLNDPNAEFTKFAIEIGGISTNPKEVDYDKLVYIVHDYECLASKLPKRVRTYRGLDYVWDADAEWWICTTDLTKMNDDDFYRECVAINGRMWYWNVGLGKWTDEFGDYATTELLKETIDNITKN
jgi:hypothetical protein